MYLKFVYVCARGGETMEIEGGFVEKVAHEQGHRRTWMDTDGRDPRACLTHKI